MARDRHVNLGGADQALLVEADEPGAAATRPALVHAVEIDEEHRFVGAIRVSDTGVQSAGDERQM